MSQYLSSCISLCSILCLRGGHLLSLLLIAYIMLHNLSADQLRVSHLLCLHEGLSAERPNCRCNPYVLSSWAWLWVKWCNNLCRDVRKDEKILCSWGLGWKGDTEAIYSLITKWANLTLNQKYMYSKSTKLRSKKLQKNKNLQSNPTFTLHSHYIWTQKTNLGYRI